ncbi:hypothetical protein D3C75_723100 [compost metagenome]
MGGMRGKSAFESGVVGQMGGMRGKSAFEFVCRQGERKKSGGAALAGDEVVLWSDQGREHGFILEEEGGLNLEQEMPRRAFWRAEIWRPLIPGESRRLLAAATNPAYLG